MTPILAIDYGLKRCGLAITDTNRIIASPLTCIEEKFLFQKLDEIIQKHNIAEIVLGMPSHLNGSDCEMQEKIMKIISIIKQRYPDVECNFYDERFTSKIALQTLVHYNFSKKDRRNKSNIDTISATLILQSYLDFKEHRKKSIDQDN